jgi:hypothetical protein
VVSFPGCLVASLAALLVVCFFACLLARSLLARCLFVCVAHTSSFGATCRAVPRLLQDNVKYLGTLEKFLEPLYKMTPVTLVDSLSALFNGIKMVYTVSR